MMTWLNQIRVSDGGLNEVGQASADANSVRLSGNPGRGGNAGRAAQQNDERRPVESKHSGSIATAAGGAVAGSTRELSSSADATGQRFS